MECYITNLKINDLRHLDNIEINLSDKKRQHLLITGKNGSGKTSLLDSLYIYMNSQYTEEKIFEEHGMLTTRNPAKILKDAYGIDKNLIGKVLPEYKTGKHITHNVLISYFRANRKLKADIPDGVEKVVINDSNPSKVLIKYLVNLKTQQSYAKNEGDFEIADNIQNWFDKFTDILRKVFESSELELKYDYKNYNFSIVLPDRKPFGFNELSDGYSALLMILSELILKIDNNAVTNRSHTYEEEGIVLIDELETHLHVELQKKILPLLIEFFPNIQFIVTTHSPFILNSIENAVIYDLENNFQTENMSGYSYEAVVETYFNISKYSDEVKSKFERYKYLNSKSDLNDEERSERATLRRSLENISDEYAPDIKTAFKELEKQRLNNG